MERSESNEAMLPEGMGFCQKHGQQFVLREGCPGCLADKKEVKVGQASVEIRGTTTAEKVETGEKEFEGLLPEKTTTAVVTINPHRNPKVLAFYNESLKMLEFANSRVIATAEDLKPATDDLILISTTKKALNDLKREYLSPIQAHAQAVNDAFKALMAPILTADQVTQDKMKAFQREEEAKRREQEEVNRLRREADERERKATGAISEETKLVEVTPEPPQRIETEAGAVGMVAHWKYEVVDFTALPDTYKVADTAMLNNIARKHHDQKPIPGVRFFNEPDVRVNTN